MLWLITGNDVGWKLQLHDEQYLSDLLLESQHACFGDISWLRLLLW